MCQGYLPTMQAMACVSSVTFKKTVMIDKRSRRHLFVPFDSFHFRTIKPPNPKNPGNSVPRVLVKPREATPGTLKGILVKKISYPPSARLVVNRGLSAQSTLDNAYLALRMWRCRRHRLPLRCGPESRETERAPLSHPRI